MTGKTKRAQPLRWRRKTGRRMHSPEGFELHRGGHVLAIVQKQRDERWFSYGMGGVFFNTAGRPTDLKTAKQDAMRRVREALTAPSIPGDDGEFMGHPL